MSDTENNDPGEASETEAETMAEETTAEETTAEETTEAGEENNGQEEQEGIDRGAEQMAEMAAAMAAEGVNVEPDAAASQVNFDSSSAESIAKGISGEEVNIDTLLKVPVSLSIEVGRTKMPLGDLLDTKEGSVIELERMLDEPLDILVNGALIAHGVVVLANERFGLQITDIISLEERARSL